LEKNMHMMNFEELYKKYNLKINGVIHVGAHYGQEYDIYKKYNIKYMAFYEPASKNFSELVKNVPQTDEIKLINKAAGFEEKKAKMFVESANNGQSNSILKPKLHLQQYSMITFDSTEDIEIISLDKDIPKEERKRYNFMNIDAQGYELEVLRGSVEVLKYIDYIYCEVNRAEVYENNAIYTVLEEFLESYEFSRKEISWEGHNYGEAFYIKQ